MQWRCGLVIVLGLFLPRLADSGFAQEQPAKAAAEAPSAAVPSTAAPSTAFTAGVRFDLEALSQSPALFAAEDLQADGVRAFYYEGVKYKGEPTRVFAYYGAPAGSGGDGKKVPAMVLIHGGGGSAFDRWVKLWNKRGYAAIAMDLCGCVPVGSYGKWRRHEHGGPPGWGASFEQLDSPIEDQWAWHAVSAVALAHSLIRSYPEVDAERIGVTGISWGGYLTSIVAGVDSRFQCAIPVYGCGFLGDNSGWLPTLKDWERKRPACGCGSGIRPAISARLGCRCCG